MKRIFTQIIYITLLFASTIGASAQNQWEALNGPFGGRVDRLYGTGTTVYMKSDREYFKSTNSGTSWAKMQTLPGNFVEDLAVSGTKLFALEYSRLSVSQDGGATWQLVSSNQFYGVYQIKVTSKGTIFVFGWNGIYVSIDEGLTWRQLLSTNSYADRFVFNSSGDVFFKLEAYNEDTGWKQSINRILYPGDGISYEGATIDLILDPPQFYQNNLLNRYSAYWQWDLQVDASGNIIFLDSQEILGSINKGDTWTSLRGASLTFATDNYLEGRLSVTPNGRIYLYRNWPTQAIFVKSSFAAGAWTKITDRWPTGAYNDYVNFLYAVDNNTIIAGSENFGPFKTINATIGPDWVLANSGMTALFGDNILVTSTNRIIFFKRGIRGYYYSDNGGTSWLFKDLISTLTNNIESIVKLIDGKLLLTSYNKIFTSIDNGNTWLPVLENGLNEVHARHYENIYVRDDNTIYMTGYHSNPINKHSISYSTDQGVTWTQLTLSGLPSDFATWYPLSITATTNGTIFFGLYNYSENQYQFWQGKEGVATKVSFPGQVDDYFYPRGLFVQNGTNVYASDGEALFSSKDSGETWSRINISSNVLIDLGDGIGVSRQGTFQVTQDDGKTWSNTTIPGAYITAIAKNETTNTFYASSSRSAYKYTQDLIIDPALLPPFIDFNWEPVAGGPFGGNARDIIITNEGKQFGLVNGRVYQTDNPNNSWTDIVTGNDYIDFHGLVYHKGSSKAYLSGYFAGTHNIAYRQDGLDWQLFAAQPPGNSWSRKLYVAIDGTLALYRGSQEGFFVWDVDHWENFLDGSLLETVFKDSEGIWYAAGYIPGVGSRFVKRSIDNGLTWEDLNLSAINNEVRVYRENNVGDVIAFSPNGLVVLDKDLDVWNSLTQNIGAGNFFGGNGDFIVGPNDEYLLFSIHLKKAFKSLDKGLTWEEIAFPSQGALVIHAAFEGANIHLSVNPQGYFYSSNLGESWTKNSVGYGKIGQSNIIHIGGDEYIISSNFGNVYRTTDAGVNWEISPTSQGIYNLKKHPDGYLLGHGTVLKKSTDNGLTWQMLYSQTAVWQIAISEAGVAYASNSQNVFFSTNPELETWTQLNITGLPTSSNIRNMSSDINGGLYLIVYDNADNQNKAYQVVFGSAIRINLPAQQNPSTFQFFNGKVYLFTQDGTLRESIDGSSWTTYTTPSGAYFTFEQNGDYWLVHGWSGVVWLSRDAGQTWQNISSTNNQLIFNDIVISMSDGRAYAAVNNAVHKSGNVVLPNDGQNPVITGFEPAHLATGQSLQPKLRIIFDEVITAAPDKNLRIHDASQSIVVPPIEVISVESGTKLDNVYEFSLTETLVFNKTYFLTLEHEAFTDIFGNPAAGFPSSTSTWRFTTISQPVVTAASPANNSTGINLNTSLSVTFDKPVTLVNGKEMGIYLESDLTTPVQIIQAETGVVSNNTITFSLLQPLDFLSDYVVKFQDNSFSAGGTNQFSAINTNTSWKFTTRDIPAVSSKTPANDAVNVPINTSISLTFAEAIVMDNEKSVSVYSTSQPATPVITYELSNASQSGNTITIADDSAFEFNTDYFIRIDGEAFSVQGKSFTVLNTDTDWKFKTIPPPDTQPPSIATPSGLNLEKGAGSKSFNITITDNTAVASGKIFYRGILTNSSTAFTEANLVAPSSGAVYTVSVPETAFDALGLEFYITAVDAAGNEARNPSAANQYLYSYINFPSAQAPKISGLPTSGTETNYRIISTSYALSNPAVTSAFQSLGAYNKVDWRMFRLPAGTASYVELGSGFSNMSRGEAYWMISKTAEFAIEGASTPPNNRNSLFSFSLVPGWNMVGNPYPVAINWPDVKGAASNVGNLNVYNGGWQTGNTMAPNSGGFVFVSGGNTTLSAPLPGVNSGGRKDNIDPGSKLDNEHWELPLTLIHGEVKNELPGIGMHPQAKEQFDQFDNPTLPRFFDYAEINFARDEPMAPYFTKDVVPTQNEYVWEFNVASNQDGLATVSWNNSDLGSAKDLVLFDVSRQLIVDMKAMNSYTFDPKNSSSFRIHFGDNLGESLKPDRVMLGNTYPNPSQGEAIVPFSISAEAGEVTIVMELYNNLGIKVGTLVEGEFEPGFHEAHFNAKSRGLSSGMYLIKLSVAGEELRETYYGKWVLNK